MMYPKLYSLLTLTALIQFAVSIPANRASSGTDTLTLVTPGDNPLPPDPPDPFIRIPGTSLTIKLKEPFGAPIPSENIARCVTAAQYAIASIARRDDLLPSQGWQFTNSNVRLSASRIFPKLGTYGQLSDAIGGLQRVMNLPGEPGEKALSWILSDDIQTLVMLGAIAGV
ncbi:hypothetical protein BDR22DRAFT_893255 [Usnea florida]